MKLLLWNILNMYYNSHFTDWKTEDLFYIYIFIYFFYNQVTNLQEIKKGQTFAKGDSEIQYLL